MNFKRFVPILTNHPKLWIFGVILVTIFLGLKSTHVKSDYTIEHFFPENDADQNYYEWFKSEFEPEDNIISIGIKRDDLWSNIELWKDFHQINQDFTSSSFRKIL